MGGSLAPSWGGGGQQTHPGEPEEVKSACLGQRRKGAQGGDGDETITMSPCTDAEGGAAGRKVGYGRVRKPGEGDCSGSSILASKTQERCSTERVRGSLQITLARSSFAAGFCWIQQMWEACSTTWAYTGYVPALPPG